MEARQMTPFFHLLFLVLLCVTFTFVFENSQLWSVKYLNIRQKLPIWTPHHTFLESRHPKVSKNSINMFVPQEMPKKVSHGLIGFRIVNYCESQRQQYGSPPQIFPWKICEILRGYSRWWLSKLSQKAKICSMMALKSPVLPRLMLF